MEDSKITVHENETFKDTVVVIDGCYFVDCRIINCELVYGGGHFKIDKDTHFHNCTVSSFGPAMRTLQFARHFGLPRNYNSRITVAPVEPTLVN